MPEFINVAFFKPFITIKYKIEVLANPLKIALYHIGFVLKLKESNIRETYCTKAPIVNATTTESKMPKMISMALELLI